MGGAERQALTLALLLKQEGFPVVMASFAQDGPVKDICEKNDIPTLCFRLSTGLANILKIAAALNKRDVNIILSYCDHANIVMALVFPFTRAEKLFWGQRDAGIGLREIGKFPGFLGLPTAAISNSLAGKEFLRTLSQTLPIHHIPNAIQPAAPAATAGEWRRRLGITAEKRVFLMVANLSRFKAHDLLLRAWALARSTPEFAGNAVLVLAGREDDQASCLRRLARSLRLETSVIFTGEVSDISGLITAADICVFSSEKEGLPNGILECMYHGLPVVALRNTGTEEACGAVPGNLLVHPHTAEAFRDALLACFRSEGLTATGRANAAHVHEHFSQVGLVSRYRELLLAPGSKQPLRLKYRTFLCLATFWLAKLKRRLCRS